jgi:Reverse transcriptase (RNA-dependent DNA polymerase)
MSDLRRGTYQPSAATTVYFPKVSRVLRPITLLSLNDQLVYQAIANTIADRYFPVLWPQYEVKAFSALYAGGSSKFFYRSWKKSYKAFNKAVKRAFLNGDDILADFDLVSFFDLIDNKVLPEILSVRVKSGEALDLLLACLECWTKGNPNINSRGHGIPQGPEASAFLAEIFLHEFDQGKYGRVKYLRYVDDVKLLGKKFSSGRRALVRLDLRSKTLGLVPQEQKIELRKVTDIDAELQDVPGSIAGPTLPRPPRSVSRATRRPFERFLRKALKRRGGQLDVKNETHVKLARNRLPPSIKTLRLVRPLLESRPDLSAVLSRYASHCSSKRKSAEILHGTLRGDPVFDAAAGDIVLALDRCAQRPEPRKYKSLIG